MSFTPWIQKATPEQLQAGESRDQAEQSAEDSYQRMHAPPCVACGEPVADKDFNHHRYTRHAWNEQVQPVGRPESREALFLAKDQDDLNRKIATWRFKHPGVRLVPSGEGHRFEGRLCWARFRILDGRGRRTT